MVLKMLWNNVYYNRIGKVRFLQFNWIEQTILLKQLSIT